MIVVVSFMNDNRLEHTPSYAVLIKSDLSSNDNDNDDGDHIERDTFEISTIFPLRCKLSPACMLKWPGHNGVQIMCNTSSAYRMPHVLCHVIRRDSSATKFDRVEITFILALFDWLKPLPSEGKGS